MKHLGRDATEGVSSGVSDPLLGCAVSEVPLSNDLATTSPALHRSRKATRCKRLAFAKGCIINRRRVPANHWTERALKGHTDYCFAKQGRQPPITPTEDRTLWRLRHCLTQ